LRFISEGPELPDDLLVARDEGNVLFFCGSGVSIARARLPGFLGLAEGVMHQLRALPDSAPQQLTQIASTLMEKKVAGVGGIVAADRIFGLLERDFAAADIDRAVGAVLRPKPDVDTTAHRTLLDLSRTANGNVQLVTTNFDLLFEVAAPKLRVWTPDALPDLHRGGFDGILHLHGRMDANYQNAVGGNLVLSSAEFGRAYLSEGWATRFIRDATERYSVVFVGYTADDPPVQYLLEALNRDRGQRRQPMYAFQAGLQSEAAALWAHKGVTAIPYDDQSSHSLLWQTLANWAERAKDPEAWRKKVLRRAMAGPEGLTPHERGQVMHLAMTPDGVKAIVTAKRLLTANWLLVFDPAERYETPGRRTFTQDAAAIDSFNDYCLDSDPVPPPDDRGALFRKREVPKEALSPFVANQFDKASTDSAAICGENAVALVSLTPRLRALTAWIVKVSGQSLAIWWALGKTMLHPSLLQSIEFQIDRSKNSLPDNAKGVWRYILDSRQPTFHSPLHGIHDLVERVSKEGWTPSVRRYLVNLLRPHVEVTRPLASGPVKDLRRARPFQLMQRNLKYRDEEVPPEIPDGELASITPLIRRLLEEISTREEELGSFALNHIPPINADPQLAGMAYERNYGLGRLVFWYIGLFQRLVALNPARARHEFDAWLAQENILFYRLQVWACGLPQFLPSETATQTLATLNDDAFWTERGQRDLLISLKARWNDFDRSLRRNVEKRLLKGPPSFDHLSLTDNRAWQAHMVLGRVMWLTQEGCAFQIPVTKILAKARTADPTWRDEFASHAADSHEGRSASVGVNPDFDQIKGASIRELLALCIAISGREGRFLVERDPLAGLVEKQPIRVLRALLLDALPDDQGRRWAWAKFLQSTARRSDTSRRTMLIARRIAEVPDDLFKLIVHAVSYWLEARSTALYEADPTSVGALADRVFRALSNGDVPSKRQHGNRADWLNSAMSSPSGHAVQALLRDPQLSARAVGEGLPDDWKQRIERGIALPDDHGLLAFYQVSQSVGWLFGRDRAWTEAVILSALDNEDERQYALLAAFLTNVRFGERALFDHLKGPISKLISGELSEPKTDPRALMVFALSGWSADDGTGRWFSDTEMRTALVRGQLEFRTTVLWQIGQWEFAEKYYFLAKVWPLQLAARSSTVTDRLCHIAFHDAEHFAQLLEVVLPFLTKISRGALMFTAGVPNANELLAANPQLGLELYWRILPENSEEWPYDVQRGLEYLHKNVKGLRSDPRMIELMRRRRKGYF